MDKNYLWQVAKRFLRAFLAGGVAQILITLASQPLTAATWTDIKKWVIVLIVAFITGGAMAVDKLLRYDPMKTN